jgi:hypothetical protein
LFHNNLSVPGDKVNFSTSKETSLISNTYDLELKFYKVLNSFNPKWGSIQAGLHPMFILYPKHTDFVKTLSGKDLALEYCIHGQNPFNKYSLQSSDAPFYVQQWDYQKLTFTSAIKELFNLNTALKNQNTVVNMFRWGYKYNVLHRRSIHNSHKLTSVKRLLSLGYFDFGITESNVWFSDQYGRDLGVGKKSKTADSESILHNS